MSDAKGQCVKLYSLLRGFVPRRTDEIQAAVYGGDHLGSARIGARVNDLRNGRWPGGFRCEFRKKGKLYGWADATNPSLSWYALMPFEEWADQAEVQKARGYDVALYGPEVAAINAIPAFNPKDPPQHTNQRSLF